MRAPHRMPLVAPILAKSTCRRQRDGVSDEVRHPIRSVCLTNCATTPRRSGFCKSLYLSSFSGPPQRDDDSQRRDRLTVTSATDVRAVDGLPRTCDSVSFGVRRIRMKRRDDSQRRDRLAVRQPVHTSCRSRTARADRAAGAFGFSTGVAAGYVWRRLSPYIRSLTTATVRDPRPPAHRRKTDRRRRRSITFVARPTTAPRGVVTQVLTSAERSVIA